MFLHEVIKQFDKKTDKLVRETGYPESTIELIKRRLKRSKSFHIGKLSSFGSLLVKINASIEGRDTVLAKPHHKLPYTYTWIDSIEDKTNANYSIKMGHCIYETNEGIDIMMFAAKHHLKWKLFQVGIQISKTEMGKHKNVWPILFHGTVTEAEKAEKSKLMQYSIVIIELFLDLLNCKNIEPKEINVTKKFKQGKKIKKKSLYKYHTLSLKPTTKRHKQLEAQGLWENRVHLCRGHFKTYTKEKPLFGSITGTFWWQPHARGSKKIGVVHKDYDATELVN